MGLGKNLVSFMLICILCSPLIIGKESTRNTRKTPYTKILSSIHNLRDAKFHFVRDIIIKNFALNNNLPNLHKIKSMRLLKNNGKNDIVVQASDKDKKPLRIQISAKNIHVSENNDKANGSNFKLIKPYFIASKIFVKQFNDHLNEIKQACSMLDLSELLDETEDLKDGINDYYSFLVPDTEESLFAELNENPRALQLLFTLKKVQRNAILKLMILTKINKKCG